MQRLTRRSFLAASAAFTAAPAFGASKQKKAPSGGPSSGVDVVIVGAGAAGIAAARRIASAGKRVVVCEAAATVGGRCITDTKTFGIPYDRGAHWLHTPETNPLAKLATQTGLDIYPAPPGQRVRIGRRYAREGEMEDLLAAIARANRAIAEAARKGDVSCASALPKDLGDWRGTIDFMLGPFASSKDLTDVSTVDFYRSVERDVDAFCRQGVGALLTRLAGGLPVRLATPVTQIDWGGRRIEVETLQGKIEARAVIVTASTNVLAAGKIKFSPALPARPLDAIGKLRLGSYERVALELPGNPLGFRSDELVFQKSANRRTAAVLGNLAGSAVCTVDIAGEFARTLSAKGEGEMAAFALDWLADLYGNDVKEAVRRRHVTRWNSEPWVLGGMSVAAPGSQSARRAMMEPLSNRVWFAGEAAHETRWGTVGGA
ncbi:MAG: flavin monoamine oxidase family protein, partial [Xanthobacteraceae bacterium]